MLTAHEMAHGTAHRKTHRKDRDEITELGHEAIKGVVTVGTVGITATMMGATLGSPK